MTSSAMSSPPSTGAAIGLITSAPTPVGPEHRREADDGRALGQQLGPQAVDGAFTTAWRSSSSDLIFSRPPRSAIASRR